MLGASLVCNRHRQQWDIPTRSFTSGIYVSQIALYSLVCISANPCVCGPQFEDGSFNVAQRP